MVKVAAEGLQIDSYLPDSSHPVLCCSVPGRAQRLRGIPEDTPLPPLLLALQVRVNQSKENDDCCATRSRYSRVRHRLLIPPSVVKYFVRSWRDVILVRARKCLYEDLGERHICWCDLTRL